MATISDNAPVTGNPYLDSLIWGCSWQPDPGDPVGPLQLNYHFGQAQDPFGSTFAFRPWSPREVDAFRLAFQLYENVANIDFNEVGVFADADIVEWLLPSSEFFRPTILGQHEVPDPSATNPPPYGYYNYSHGSWAYLAQGAYGFVTIIHELGHALGLAHPHDGGDPEDEPTTTFPGVTYDNPSDTGDFGLNQGIWTTMSYNDGWDVRPGVYPSYGFQGTPMAFDIAALQALYGANTTYNTGDNVYVLPGKNAAGTFWSCIWDAGGGTDEISAAALTGACTINLNDATLQAGDPNAGGFVSSMGGIRGGFTIANSVVIENATGGSGNDSLTGNEVVNVLTGNAGNDTLDGQLGADDLRGGNGDDTYMVDNAGDKVTELSGGGIDRVWSSTDHVLDDEVENLTLVGSSATDGTGNGLDNTLIGNIAANILDGGDGSDSIEGGGGADTMKGGAGDDTYLVNGTGEVFETLDEGIDTVRSFGSFNLGDNIENLTLLGVSKIDGTGNGLNNLVIGNYVANVIDGGAGADTMRGNAGDDTYIVDSAGDVVTEDSKAGTDTVRSTVSYTLAATLENLVLLAAALAATGNALANELTGNDEANTLDGKAAADIMTGGKGNDLYIMDNAGDLVIELGGDAKDTVQSAVAFKNAIAGIEDYTFTGKTAVAFTANDENNRISATAAADTLDGGKGIDALLGGAGNDVYFVDAATDKVTENLNQGLDLVKSSTSFTLDENIEKLELTGSTDIDGTGNALANTITGNSGKNGLFGLGGKDTLTGNDGNDTLDGGADIDRLVGGKGDDSYIVDSSKDVISETLTLLTGGVDLVQSSASFVLGANLDNLELIGGLVIDGTGNTLVNALAGNEEKNKLSGLAGNDELTGKAGNDTLDGGAGDDAMAGGEDDDLYIQDSAKDQFSDTGSTAGDELRTNQSTLTGAIGGIEHYTFIGSKAVTFAGGVAANRITGTAAADSLTGDAGNDTLSGLGGNDTLAGGNDHDSLLGGIGNDVLGGGANDDTLDGGAGIDNLDGGAGNDSYVVDSAKDAVKETAGNGTDVIIASIAIDLNLPAYDEIENAKLIGTAALKLTGDLQDNDLTGNDGANLVTGGAGADAIAGGKGNDTLDGGVDGSADALAGGLGNDTYLIGELGEIVTEAEGEGTDIVRSAVSHTLSANVENLILLAGAAGAIDAIGNGLKNAVTGNDLANTLDGGTGVDTLVGGKGNDTYFVDETKDVVTEAFGKDTGNDTVHSTAATYTLSAYVENLTLEEGAGDISGTGNTLNNILTGNTGDNTLNGGSGADTLNGGLGNDTYVYDGKDAIDDLGGFDVVQAAIAIDLTLPVAALENIEGVMLTGAGAVAATGDENANLLVGNAGANKLTGNDGADTIEGAGGNDTIDGGQGNDEINVTTGNDTVRYTTALDGHDVISNFDGNASGGQDVLNLDALFDSLGVATADRAGSVTVGPLVGNSVEVEVDGVAIATLNLANAADAITVGTDVVVGTL